MKYLKLYECYIKEHYEENDYWNKVSVIIKKVIINLGNDLRIASHLISDKLIKFGIPVEMSKQIGKYMYEHSSDISVYSENRIKIEEFINNIIDIIKNDARTKLDNKIDTIATTKPQKIYNLGIHNN